MFDPIADMLTRIRNGIAVNKAEVEVPYSKTKVAVAKVLKENNYIDDFKTDSKNPRVITIQLSDTSQHAVITEIHRISKPGRRVYVSAQDIPSVLRGRGIVIVSTSSGVMTGDAAKKLGVGGELMCKVW